VLARHETTTLLLATSPDIHRLKKIHSHSNKPFLIWLLTTPPHLKYVVTLPRNLSLIACFADINVLQGSVATYARCGGMFNYLMLCPHISSVDKIIVLHILYNYVDKSDKTLKYLCHASVP